MDIVSLSWAKEKRRAEVVLRPGYVRLLVDRLHRIDADGEGRMLRAVLGPSTWRRSYADRYVEIRSEAVEGERFHIPFLAMAHNALSVILRVRTLAEEARDAAKLQGDPNVVAALERVTKWDVDTLADDGDRFRRIYKKVGSQPPIFTSPPPPDQQLAIVVQPRADFARHVATVIAFMGKALPMRQGVYIDHEAEPAELPPMLAVLGNKLPGQPVAATLKTPVGANWAALRAAGLSRVYVPLEACREDDIVEARLDGVAVSLLAPAPETLDDADALAVRVNLLPLEGADTVYIMEPTPYPFDAERRLVLRRAFHHLRTALRFAPNPAGPIVTHYPLLQSVY